MSIDHTPQTAPPAPHLSLVKNPPAAPAAGPKKLTVEPRPRPEWMKSGKVLKQYAAYGWANSRDFAGHHATHLPYYVVWSPRGYWRLAQRWRAARHDDYPQMISSAKRDLRNARGNLAAEAKAAAVVTVRRAEYAAHKKKHRLKTALWTTAGVTGSTVTVAAGPWWLDLLLGAGAVGVGAYHGRPEKPAAAGPRAPRRPSQLGEDTLRRVLVEAGVVPEKKRDDIRGVGLPHKEGPGFAAVTDLPSGIPAASALPKAEQIASALGVHKDWIDLEVVRGAGSNASRLKLWLCHEDPFAKAHTSPLVGHQGALDLWSVGAPLAFGKRGNTVHMRLRDSMILVGGATRRGKGMFIANLNLAAAKDVRINLRLFDGKASGEHNALAGVLATFVKKNPERLALFLRAVLEDMDRRSDFLDERNRSKLTEDLIDEIGGLELITIDELATYTAKGTSDYRDEILESLCQIGAVGASLGVLLECATQVPEVDVVPGRLRQNLISRAAMNTESPSASNVILGDGMAGQGYDASLIPLDQPGRFWLKTPDLGMVPLRTFVVEDDDKPAIIAEAFDLRKEAGRLPGQWRDPIEARLTAWTGVSSAAGGARGNGRITKVDLLEQLEILAKNTGRGNVTNAEIFAALAATDSAKYAQREGETDTAWATRVGRNLVVDLDATGAGLEAKRVPAGDGTRSRGYLLEDITTARNAPK
ncbi:FtsK/SpoIIIE domain-containing protein [Streptomyces sp. NPDC045456]|uniref:FtsK/SpoIIIE domain-containing protein n=1 Tax=Streptomyces sp. NPDC045456 TaxID=3155254 RepID=UPI0033DA929C